MISKEKAIEILEKALANPRYLGGPYETRTSYFCSSVMMVLVDEPEILMSDADEIATHIQNTYIYPSINECMFLRTYLVGANLLPCNIDRYDEAYKVEAHRHWQQLIDRLKGEIEYDATLYIPGTPFEMKGKVSNIVHD